jgi:hypothetical protein
VNPQGIVVAIGAFIIVILALVYLMQGDNDDAPGRPSPHAIDQSQ